MASDPESWTEAEHPLRPGRTEGDTGHGAYDLLERGWQALEYSSVYLALVGAAEVLLVTLLLSLPLTPAALVVALVTFAVYANDRLVDLETDELSAPARTAFVRRHRRVLSLGAALAYGVGAALAALGGPVAFAIAMLPGAAWVVYAVDWLDVSVVESDRLKEVPVVSSGLVSVAWALTVVVLPVAYAGAALTPTVAVLFAFFTLATFVNAEVANVRDVESDTANGVATLATVLGERRTRLALLALTASTAVLLGVAVVSGFLGVLPALALATGSLALVGVVALVGHVESDRKLSLAAECTRLPPLAILVALPLF